MGIDFRDESYMKMCICFDDVDVKDGMVLDSRGTTVRDHDKRQQWYS